MTPAMIIVALIFGFGIAQLRHDRAKYGLLYAGLIAPLLWMIRRFGDVAHDFDVIMEAVVVCGFFVLVIIGYPRFYRFLNKRL